MANIDRYVAYHTGFEGTGDTYGTINSDGGADNKWYKMRVTQFSDPINRQPAIEETLKLKAAAAVIGGPYKVGGGFEGFFRPKNMMWAVSAMMGYPGNTQAASDDPFGAYNAASPKKLEMTLGSQPRALTLRVGDDQAYGTGNSGVGNGRIIQYGGVGVKSMELSMTVGAAATAKFGWIGKHATIIEPSAGDTTFGDISGYIDSTEEGSYFYNGVVQTSDDGNVWYDCEAKGFTMTIDRKFDENYYTLGTPYLRDLIINGLTSLNGTITFGSKQWDALRQTIIGNITDPVLEPLDNPIFGKYARLKLFDPTGATSTCCFAINNMKYIEFNRSVQGRNQFEKTLNWQASLKTDDDFKITIGDVDA